MRKLDKENIVNNLLVFIKNHWALIVVFILGLTPLLWYKPGFLFARGDYFPFVNPLANTRFMYLWSDASALGSIPQAGNPSPMQSIWFGIWYILSGAGLSTGVIQILLEVAYFLGAGLSMYLLASTVYKQGQLTPFIASVFYMFNLIMFFRNFNDVASWFLVLIPLMVFFYIRIIRSVRQNRRIIIDVLALAATSAVLLGFSVTNPSFTILTVALFLVLFLYSIVTETGNRLKVIKALIILSIVTLLLNIWWIVPFLFETLSYAGGASSLGTTTAVTGWTFVYGRSSFLNLFSFTALWNWVPEYVPYLSLYENPLMQLILFVPMILAFSALLFRGKYRKINLCFAIASLVLIFLAKGLHPPFGDVNLFLYNHLPGAFIFREPFLKLYSLLIIPLALLIGFTTTSITLKLRRTKIRYKKAISQLLVVLIVLSFAISVFPIFNNDLLFTKTDSLPFSTYVQIPTYWYQASDYINSIPGNFRVLQTPGDDYYQIPYQWGYYGSDAVASSLISKPVVQNSFGYASVNDLTSLIYRKIDENKTTEFTNLLAIANIKYIIQRNDVWWNYSGRTIDSPDQIKGFLTNSSGIKLDASFGPLDIYEVLDNRSLPKIYPTDSAVIINGTISDFAQSISNENTSIQSAFFLTNQLTDTQFQLVKSLPNTLINNKSQIIITPENGTTTPFQWVNMPSESTQIRHYTGWKIVVRTDGNQTQDTMSFPSIDSCPYEFSSAYNGTSWAALNSTLVYIKTGNEPIAISEILENNQPITDIIGAWWQTGWEGMYTKPVDFPIIIPANQNAIIQINHIATENLTLIKNPIPYNTFLVSDNAVLNQSLPQISYKVVNPTKVEVTVTNATQPFLLIFAENYDSQWKAYISSGQTPQQATIENMFTPQDIFYLGKQPLDNQYHLIANGYANAWYIDPQKLNEGTSFTVTLFFVPQAYNYAATILTLIAVTVIASCLVYTYYKQKRGKINYKR